MMLNIAIDGPAGAGKSTTARRLAQHLNILYLDTGAMYRALGLKSLRAGVNPTDILAVEKLLLGTKISVEYIDGTQHTFLDGEDVSEAIREHHVSRAASEISAIKAVRTRLVELQREIASANDLVLDGRDIGTHVLPDAPFKFYLTASAEERANRRYKELCAKGAGATYEEILRDIKARDFGDMTRKFAPLCKAADAIEIDSTNLTEEGVFEAMISHIQPQG